MTREDIQIEIGIAWECLRLAVDNGDSDKRNRAYARIKELKNECSHSELTKYGTTFICSDCGIELVEAG